MLDKHVVKKGQYRRVWWITKSIKPPANLEKKNTFSFYKISIIITLIIPTVLIADRRFVAYNYLLLGLLNFQHIHSY